MPGMRLLAALRAQNLIRDGEEALLQKPEVKELPPQAQLEYLRTNRRAGLFVLLIAGGLRLLLLAGAIVTLLAFSICGWMPPAAGVPLALCAFALLIWLAPGYLQKLKILRQPLPDYLELL